MYSYRKTLKKTSSFLILSALLGGSVALQAASNSQGQPFQDLQDQIDDLQMQIDQLESDTGDDLIALTVDCDAGESINDALASVTNPVAPLMVTIDGVCEEAVDISRDNVTLEGSSPASGILGPPGEIAAILVD